MTERYSWTRLAPDNEHGEVTQYLSRSGGTLRWIANPAAALAHPSMQAAERWLFQANPPASLMEGATVTLNPAFTNPVDAEAQDGRPEAPGYVTLTPNYANLRTQFAEEAQGQMRSIVGRLEQMASASPAQMHHAKTLAGDVQTLVVSLNIVAQSLEDAQSVEQLRHTLEALTATAAAGNTRVQQIEAGE